MSLRESTTNNPGVYDALHKMAKSFLSFLFVVFSPFQRFFVFFRFPLTYRFFSIFSIILFSIVAQGNRCPAVPHVLPCSLTLDGGIDLSGKFVAFFGQKNRIPVHK